MPLITDIESALIDALKLAFTASNKLILKTVDSLPGEFDADSLQQMITEAPAVYVLFLGGKRREENLLALDSSWAIYIVTKHAGGHRQRRQGDGRQIGAYEMLQIAIPAIENVEITDCGRFEAEQVSNLFTGRLNSKGVSAYAVTFGAAMMLPPLVDPASLNDFVTYHSDYAPGAASLPLPDEGQPTIDLTLEQPQ